MSNEAAEAAAVDGAGGGPSQREVALLKAAVPLASFHCLCRTKR